MTLALGCIADDYTGASDLANTLTRCGLRTVQTIGVPSDDLALPDVDAVVVSLKSRSIEAGLAVSRSRAAEKWLRGRGADHVLFKICSTFDSTDAGNIGPVMDALRADSGDGIVLVTPAFPETGRTVYQGNLFVGSVPLNESPLKDHPLNPMHDSNLVRVLARQSRTKIGLVDLAAIARGPDAVRARLADLAAKGIGAAIADAVFERDLETIGQVALDHGVSVGASGLGLGLARALVASAKVEIERSQCDVRRGGRRTGGVSRRELLAGDAAADRQRRTGHAGASSRSRSGGGRPGRGPARAVLGQGSSRRRSGSDRLQLDAGPGRGSAVTSWPRCSRTCHRTGDGRYRGRLVRVRRASAGGRGRRNLRRGGGSPADSGLSGGAGNRCRCPGIARRRREAAATCCWR